MECKTCNGKQNKSFNRRVNGLLEAVFHTKQCPDCEGLGIHVPKIKEMRKISYYRTELTGFVDIFGSNHLGWDYYRKEGHENHRIYPDPGMKELLKMMMDEKEKIKTGNLNIPVFISCKDVGYMILNNPPPLNIVEFIWNPYSGGEWMIKNGAYHLAVKKRWDNFLKN